MVMDAVCKIDGVNGKRDVAIADFFTGPGKTVLENGEILTGFFVPAPKPHTGATYEKFAIRGDTDISIVGAGCSLTLSKDGTVTDARISLAAVAPKPIRATKAENFLVGKKITEAIALETGELAGSNCNPISDQRASKEYRVEMVKVWVKNAILEANQRADN
jgi:carbon-monoxide dehydrogenase medium subunit